MLKKIAIIGPESTGKSTLCEQLAQHYNTLWCPEYAREYLTIHGMTYTFDDLLVIAKGQVELEDKYVRLATLSLQSSVQKLARGDDSRLTTDDSRLTPDDSRLTTDDSRLTIDDSRLTTDDSRFTTDDSRFTTDDSRLTTHDSRLTQSTPLFIDTEMYVMKVWCEFVFGKCHQYILDQLSTRKYDLYFLCNIDLPWTSDPLREYPDLERRQELYNIYKDIMKTQPVQWVDISGTSEERFLSAVRSVNALLK